MGGRGRHFKKRREIRKKRNEESRRRERSQSRQRRRNRKRKKERMRRRAERVVSRFGDRAKGVCAEKNRYATREVAEDFALRQGILHNVSLTCYRCPYCGGWHLTSHPRERSDDLLPSEILQRSREAALRMRAIEAEIVELRERIGVQGHTYGYTPKNDIRDPMRHVLEMVDGTAELEAEKLECQKDINDAWGIVCGLSQSDRFTSDAEYLVASYFIYAKGMGAIARETGQDERLCKRLLKDILEWADEVGIQGIRRLAHAGNDA